MFEIEFSVEAYKDLQYFKTRERKIIIEGIKSRLVHEPQIETRNTKKLRPNDVADWELRIGKFRIFYNIDFTEKIVSVEAIGFKIGNLLFIRKEKKSL